MGQLLGKPLDFCTVTSAVNKILGKRGQVKVSGKGCLFFFFFFLLLFSKETILK